MKQSLLSSSFALSILLSSPLYAKTPHTLPPSPSESLSSTASSVTRATLKNGLRVVIIPNNLAPVVTTEVNYLVGSTETAPDFPGTAHALEHMMFRGSEGLDKDQLAAIGAQIGGSYNAFTTETVTQYFYTAPAEDLDVMLRIEAMRMGKLSLNAKDWEKEKGAIEQEVSRDLSSPIYKYISQLQNILFQGTPYAHDPLGTRPSFEKTDVARLKSFYDKWYAPNNAILVIAGNVDPQKTLENVKQHFDSIPSKKLPTPNTVALTPLKAQTLNLPTDLPVGIISIAFRMPGQHGKDFATANLLADILNSKRGKLYELVPQGKALFSEFDYIPKGRVGFGLAVVGFPKGQDPKGLHEELKSILQDIQKNGVPKELLEASRQRELAQMAFQSNSISGLASTWSEALAFQGLNSPADMEAAYKSVTLQDVNAMAKTILAPEESITAFLTPQESGKPIAQKGFGGAESFASVPDKPVKLPQWAEKALNTLSIPPKSPLPVDITLENGLRLIVQTVHISPTISLFGNVRHESSLQEPKGQEGISDITSELFSYGTTTLDRLSFQKALDDIAADENAGFSFSLSTLTPQFEKGLKLLSDNQLRPAFPEKAFMVVRQQQAQAQIGLLKSPGYLFRRAVLKALNPPNDPTLREATPDQMMKISLEDVKKFYHDSFRPDLTTIVIVGNITPQHAKKLIADNFGQWKNIGPKPIVDLPTRPDNKTSHAVVPDNANVQDTVILATTTGVLPTSTDHYYLNLANEILGGGFSSRLYKDLRVKTGYVYTVSSQFGWSRTRSGYAVTYGADPDKVSKASTLVVKNIKELQSSPVSNEELTLAKASLLRRIPLDRASVDSIGRSYLALVNLNLPLDNDNRAAQYYFKATQQDIQNTFKKWIRPDDIAQIVKGPTPK
ncbi:M16 family metallopeptidase [Entomobacter blattae]|uniref:Peptidase M16 inactive domain protein n=1 Tax=Entomobacter blattae TaxID=2762277 RepID=A0A7H1NTH9_9PROT|nr:pitrilysin family protein [Entomobacter blattae]QNT79089.1 Peptidase M16 inactive domain protein [Entomobacter blattae]